MTISAVLLAGGKSLRMGEDKATILFRSMPLWKIQLELLRKLQPGELFISAQSDPPWRPADVQFVADEQPSRGPLSGIASVLSQITTEHLVALAIDMPFMNASYLRALWRRIEPGRGIVPVIDDRFEPLAAIYSREALPDFTAALSGDDFSLQSLITKLVAAGKMQSVQVSERESGFFRNLNEPADLESS
jgi:molybdopterin-guanine dinucleotide biosynthesis protein A